MTDSTTSVPLEEVFTPNDAPTHTYEGRDDLRLEDRLSASLRLAKMVVSVSGPSKTGKSVLIGRVIDSDLVIPVVGSGISSADELWSRALRWMDVPTATTVSQTITSEVSGGARAGGGFNIPFMASANAEVQTGGRSSSGSSTAATRHIGGVDTVIREIGNSAFVVFIDDFHYIPEGIREEVGRQIKVASDNGVKILTASVPHRIDDVVRSNPELAGRVVAIDLGRWDSRHIVSIANKGFEALGVLIAPDVVNKIVDEASGSPQLMQAICYNLCVVKGIRESQRPRVQVEVSDQDLTQALLHTAQFTDMSKLLSLLHAGPRTRGMERKIHKLIDNTEGDVYRTVLLALRLEPILLSMPYDEIFSRVKRVCVGEAPAGSSVTSALEQMHEISETERPLLPAISWDGDNVDIADPYFAFFLRRSDKVAQLARR